MNEYIWNCNYNMYCSINVETVLLEMVNSNYSIPPAFPTKTSLI